MKNFTLSALCFLLVSFGAIAQNDSVDVTFMVDMSAETVSGDGVQVVIKSPWIWTAMTDAGDGIWEATVGLPINESYPYSFVNGAQDYWDGEERLPSRCNYGTETAPERKVTIAAADTVLEITAFGDCPSSIPLKVDVTFKIEVGGDSIAENGIWLVVKGPWQWDSLQHINDDIWGTTIEFVAGETIPYTFVYGGKDNWDGEEDKTIECIAGGDRDDAREFVVPEYDISLYPVSFSGCLEGPTSDVLFGVDMNNADSISTFGVQMVTKGPWMWNPMLDKDEDGIFMLSLQLLEGETYPYTFINGAQDMWDGEERIDGPCNYGSETAPERRVTVPVSDTSLEVVDFGGCGTIVLEKVNVTFRVDMSGETVSGDGVQVVIKDPWIWTAMTDIGDGIWEATVELLQDDSYPYSFVNGAVDYWAGEEVITGECKDGENNQRLAVVEYTDKTLPAFVFGTCTKTTVSSLQMSDEGIFIYPNPAYDMIFLKNLSEDVNNIRVYNVIGTEVLHKPVNRESRVWLKVDQLINGVYFIRVEENGRQYNQKILINR